MGISTSSSKTISSQQTQPKITETTERRNMSAKNNSATSNENTRDTENLEKKDTIIPAQAENTDDKPLELIEGGKKSFKDRLSVVTGKVKENKAATALGVALAVTVGMLIKNRLGISEEESEPFDAEAEAYLKESKEQAEMAADYA